MAKHTFFLKGEPYTPEHLTKDEGVEMQAGDSLRLEPPGGGGYGDPRERPEELVLEDVRRGYYDRETAERAYRLER